MAFCERFRNEERACLAIGGLPVPLIEGERARRMVATIEQKRLTPLGLRSLASDEPGCRPHYSGCHQGTVSPWLIGPFVQAWSLGELLRVGAIM